MQVPPGFDIKRAGNRLWIRPGTLAETLDPVMSLALEDLRRQPDSQPAAAGRAAPFHIPVPHRNGRLLIRPYKRGGLLARLFPDGFPNLKRGIDELTAGIKARELGLPVAELAAVGAELLPSKRWAMEAWSWWKPETSPLPALLKMYPADPEGCGRLLLAVAETIRRCHEAGLLHKDLNANNIIVRSEPEGFQATLVDLDKSRFLPIMPQRLRLAQIRRLYRSLAKEGIIPSILPEEEFLGLVRAYFRNELPERKLAAFMRGCRAQVYFHSLLWRR